MLIDRARRALNELDRARAELRADPDRVAGIVTVGVLESVADAIVEPLVSAVAEHHPGIELRILTAYSGHLREWLDSGDLDLSLLYDLADSPSLAVTPLLRERLSAVGPPDAGLTPTTPVPWATLLERPLVLPMPGHGLRALVDQSRPPAGTKFQISVETNSMRVQKQPVMGGHGWTILPAIGVAREVAAGLLSAAHRARGRPIDRAHASARQTHRTARGRRRRRPGEPGPEVGALGSVAVGGAHHGRGHPRCLAQVTIASCAGRTAPGAATTRRSIRDALGRDARRMCVRLVVATAVTATNPRDVPQTRQQPGTPFADSNR